MDPIFVHPTVKYDSYTDYRKLVEVSKFEICNQDQIDINKKSIYIVTPMNGDVEAALKARPKNTRQCKIIWWFLERPSPYGGEKFANHVKDMLNNLVEEVWVSDRAIFRLIEKLGNTKFIPMGSDEALGSKGFSDKSIDFTHMSYVYGRRSHIINHLKGKIGSNGWGEERHNTLLRTKFMVNVHQDNDAYYEPLRFALCAAYGIPMLSEACSDPFPYESGVDFLSAIYNNLNKLIEDVHREGLDKHRLVGERMWDKATRKFRFINNIKEAIK